MLTEKNLSKLDLLPVRLQNISVIREALKNNAIQNGIDLECEISKLRLGGLLNSSVVDCLVLYHPIQKNRYYKYALVAEVNGVGVYYFGKSKNQKKLGNRAAAKNVISTMNSQARQNAAKGNDVGMTVTLGALIGGAKALSSLGGSKKKQQDEDNYYTKVSALINYTLSNF